MTVFNDRAGFSARETELELRDWLRGGLNRKDGRLAMFDTFGEPIRKAIVRAAISEGLAEPWFSSPMRPQWMICRLTAKGRAVLRRSATSK